MTTHYKPISRFFPKGHAKEGQPTYFVEKIWKSLLNQECGIADCIYDVGEKLGYQYADDALLKVGNSEPKEHTIRQGNKVKVGDFIQFYVWSGKPYRSKWLLIALPIEVKKTWNFEIKQNDIYLDGVRIYDDFSRFLNEYEILDKIAKDDGLTTKDLLNWFQYPKPFSGQILCWSSDILY